MAGAGIGLEHRPHPRLGDRRSGRPAIQERRQGRRMLVLEDRLGQRVAPGAAPAVVVGQLQQIAVQAEGQLARDVGLEERLQRRRASARRAARRGASGRRPELRGEIGRHERDVGRRAQHIEAERHGGAAGATQEAVIGVDEGS